MQTKSTNKFIGFCPNCNYKVYFNGKSYKCENYDNNESSCKFSFSGRMDGNKMPRKEIIKILNGKKTKTMRIKLKDGSSIMGYFYYCCERKSVCFYGTSAKSGPGKCLICGDNTYITDNAFFCGNLKSPIKPCNFYIDRKKPVTQIEYRCYKKILRGGKSGPYTYLGKDGKFRVAQLYYSRKDKSIVREYIAPLVKNCPDCGAHVIHCGSYVMCSNTKNSACEYKLSIDKSDIAFLFDNHGINNENA